MISRVVIPGALELPTEDQYGCLNKWMLGPGSPQIKQVSVRMARQLLDAGWLERITNSPRDLLMSKCELTKLGEAVIDRYRQLKREEAERGRHAQPYTDRR